MPFSMVNGCRICALIPAITVSGKHYYLFPNKEVKTQVYFPKAILGTVDWRGFEPRSG